MTDADWRDIATANARVISRLLNEHKLTQRGWWREWHARQQHYIDSLPPLPLPKPPSQPAPPSPLNYPLDNPNRGGI